MSTELNKRKNTIDNKLRSILSSGEIPSPKEIMRIVNDKTTLAKSSASSIANTGLIDNQFIRPADWNDLADGLEEDLLAMYGALDESWASLLFTTKNILSNIPSTIRKSESLYQKTIRSISLGNLSSTEAVSMIDLSNIDVSMSSGFEIDLEAGVATLSRASIGDVISDASDYYEIDSDAQTTIESVLGYPSYTTNSEITQCFTVCVASPSEYGAVSLSMAYVLGSTSQPISRISVSLPDSELYTINVEIEPITGDNPIPYGSMSGRNKIIIDGGTTSAQTARLTITKAKSSESSFIDGVLKYHYIFRVGIVTFSTNVYDPLGEIVSDPIDIGGAPIASVIIDGDYTADNGSSVSFLIAKNIESNSVDDLRWIPIEEIANPTSLVAGNAVVDIVTMNTPSKLTSGVGSAFDVYAVKKVDSKVISVEEGIDQFEMRARTVVWASNTLSTKWTQRAIGVVGRSGEELPDPFNYYLFTTNIVSDTQGSAPFIFTTNATNYIITYNDEDITQSVKDGSTSISLLAGEQTLCIALQFDHQETKSFSLDGMPGRQIMICKDRVVSNMSLGIASNCATVLSDGMLVVNHDPTGRVIRVSAADPSASDISSIRVKAVMQRGYSGSSPIIKDIYVTMGV